jgi:hypothetical protein
VPVAMLGLIITFRFLGWSPYKLDLLHIDIQGGEAALVREYLSLLFHMVAYVVVGTQSRQIMNDFLRAGSLLEVERPAILMIHEHRPDVPVDGVQG